jgi:hypothetical protein
VRVLGGSNEVPFATKRPHRAEMAWQICGAFNFSQRSAFISISRPVLAGEEL